MHANKSLSEEPDRVSLGSETVFGGVKPPFFMLTRSKKEDIVNDLSNRFSRQKIAIFTNFHGISVLKAQALRRLLKKDGAEYKVARKTLVERALRDQHIDSSAHIMAGELGIAFGYEDQAAPAKTIVKFGKENEPFAIFGALLGGKILGRDDVVAFAKLPSREILLAQVAGALQAPLRELVLALAANMRNLVTVLNKVKEKKP